MKSILTKIIPRVILLIIILFVFNYFYKKYFYKDEQKKYSDLIEHVWEIGDSCEMIYLGESSNFTFRSNDKNRKSISNLVAEYYPEVKFGTVNKGAIHAGNYLRYLENIPKENTVKTVIVTLNMRSFNGQWLYSNLETALQKEMVLLNSYPPLINRILLSFKGYDIKTNKERERQFKKFWKKSVFQVPFPLEYKTVTEWDKYMFHDGIKKEDGTKDWEKSELACHYIKAYALQIDSKTNPRVKDFDNIVKLCKQRGWNLVFNLMAENVEKADKLVGDKLTWFMYKNRDFLVNRYHNKGVLVVDNLDNIEDEQFIDQNWTTEHYAEKGRKIIARNVADTLKLIHETNYSPVTYDIEN